jgi:tRNA 2-thiouridine synthesizing protein A
MQNRKRSTVTARWDAGETGCSQLIVGLRRQLEQLPAGAMLEVVARDAGAPVDLWVWCRMTGQTVIHESHPVYVIQRTADLT